MVVKNKISEKTWEEYEIDIIENFAQTMGAAITKNRYKTMLEAAKEKAEAASRAKTEFLKSISHEIKTPLNVINGLTGIMQKETGSKKQLSYLQLIEKSVKDLMNVVNNILHFTSRNETEIIIPSDAAGKTDLSSSKVLIVEDNEVNTLILKKILQSWNIRYSHVASGREALREFSEANYDLILLDLMLPDIDGYDVVKQIRLRYSAEKSGVPVIAITASLINDETEKLKEAGINDYLVKPFHPDSLLHKMQILLHKKKAAV
jgi:CheY-like chemotaxis protein